MVTVHPNPPPGQDFGHLYSYHFGGDPISTPTGAGVEGPSKKIRKPYTITKSRENWSEQEHDKFIEAIHLFDRDWKKIEAFVASKTVIQIRSHAQKYFMKVQKNGTSEHVPPPRPKRKAAHPYPHKAPKKVASQPSEPLSSSALLNSRYALGPQSMTQPLYTWTPSGMLTDCVSPLSKGLFCDSIFCFIFIKDSSSEVFVLATDDFASSGCTMTHNWSSNCNEIAPRVWTSNEANHLVNEKPDEKRAMPDFHQVYSFIGNLFDPSASPSPSEHLKTLKKMDPITVKTVLMLMKNLSVNLVSPEFENHRMLLSSYSNADNENESIGSQTPAAAA